MTSLPVATGGGGQVAEIARTFGVDWPHLIAQMISFGIVCALLYWLAYRPVLAMLDARRQQIAAGPGERRARSRPSSPRSRRSGRSAGGGQAESAKADRRSPRRRRRACANRRAQQASRPPSRSCARRTKRRPGACAHAGRLSREVGRLVVQTTAAVTGKVLTPDDQRRLAEETARRLTAT